MSGVCLSIASYNTNVYTVQGCQCLGYMIAIQYTVQGSQCVGYRVNYIRSVCRAIRYRVLSVLFSIYGTESSVCSQCACAMQYMWYRV